MGTYHNLGRAPGTKTHGLPKNGFRFFFRTVITEKSDNVRLKNSTKPPSNRYHQIKARRSLLSQKQVRKVVVSRPEAISGFTALSQLCIFPRLFDIWSLTSSKKFVNEK
ncbi:hypothetical protein PROFUN_11256 [Planoprotostelium fungivorum]|uniref:Uncharacterized protein n=1 Tax=Planoprotostelium fungivorum TaxID=1890364 RepID=A0A2P6NAF3_9EUKA|nr:hypothetical protein PROFUN_11256 [Planoprotostelium fungivorum]